MPELGQLLVQVFTSRSRIPVPGATVALSRPGDVGKHNLLALRVTDENGRAGNLTLAAPPAAESETPGQGQPFARCDIRVEHPEYQTILIEDVQVFAGVETLQEVELLPLPEHPSRRDDRRVVLVTPQPL